MKVNIMDFRNPYLEITQSEIAGRKLLKTILCALLLILMLICSSSASFPLLAASATLEESGIMSLSDLEQQLIALINGSRAYNHDLELEQIAFSHPDFRSSGSVGAAEAANYIKNQFTDFGLDAWLEPFQFKNWTLKEAPALVVDEDGNPSTTNDQTAISSFQCEHCSWPTPDQGVFADLVVLPLPDAADHTQLGTNPINTTAWDAVDTTGKILLIGREVRGIDRTLAYQWIPTFIEKIQRQKPAAIVYTWWYDFMGFIGQFYSSSGGVPMYGGYYWQLGIPTGFVNYADGLLIRNEEIVKPSVAAKVAIRSVIEDEGVHYNVVGRILGLEHPEKIVIVSSHYDTVMCSGFCDNGAGTAGIIELAKVFTEADVHGIYKPSYTLLFVAFTAEEFWLAGSANYVKQHKGEMTNVTAVVNLDCIGSNDLYVTETAGSDLANAVIQAGQDLGLTVNVEGAGGSDQESFRVPAIVNDQILSNWDVDLGISDATPVAASAMVVSYPLIYSDLWYTGEAGWIHTPNDNSTSTGTLNWVEQADLENHIKVAALTLMRLSPNIVPEFTSGMALAFLIAATFLICFVARKTLPSKKT